MLYREKGKTGTRRKENAIYLMLKTYGIDRYHWKTIIIEGPLKQCNWVQKES